ncbi:MAG: DUF1295 domain-containing protein [Candidatus Delongbacteria bacterium]|nr:DUF1295 domain-containing protein [Candidatus Delongbacteria bacterium]
MASHHHDRDDLTGEHRLGDAGQLILALLFALVWLTDSFLLHWTTFLNREIAVFLRVPLGTFLLMLSTYLAWTSIRIVFGEVREQPAVIRQGVFNLVRHPMYLSEILLYLGLLLLSLSLAATFVWLLAIIFLHFISRHEEKLLLERFGNEYARYLHEVPMWIPGWHRSG